MSLLSRIDLLINTNFEQLKKIFELMKTFFSDLSLISSNFQSIVLIVFTFFQQLFQLLSFQKLFKENYWLSNWFPSGRWKILEDLQHQKERIPMSLFVPCCLLSLLLLLLLLLLLHSNEFIQYNVENMRNKREFLHKKKKKEHK